jgi:hypothetical protein
MWFENVVRLALWPAALVAAGITAALILTSDSQSASARLETAPPSTDRCQIRRRFVEQFFGGKKCWRS